MLYQRRNKHSMINEMIQEFLKFMGYSITDKSDASGEFGIDTEKAIKSFQAEQNITIDGVFGPETWGKMKAALVSLMPPPQRG